MRTSSASSSSCWVLAGLFLVACSGTASPASSGDGGGGGDGAKGGDGAGGGACHSDSECPKSDFETCVRVEDPQCGGIGPPQSCSTDASCADAGPGHVCNHGPCGATMCVAACKADADCGSNPAGVLACDVPSGHCVSKPCQQSTDCPTNYACTQNACAPKACTTDADCSGACVDGVCSSAIGMCRAPAA
jgi:hypothetical protein